MRRAFVAGSNGPSHLRLKYANSDARSLASCLSGSKCGFDVVSPTPGSSSTDVRKMLFKAVEDCRPDDEFICYLSGHGSLYKGTLYLLWDETNDQELLTTVLWISDILLALNFCRARNKLLILDCCRAGAVVNMGDLKPNDVPVEEVMAQADNYCVLMASGRLEKARELDEIQGGFLTKNLIAALTTEFETADLDRDNRISLTDIMVWLERRTNQHNQTHYDKQVPTPYLFGQRKGAFYFTWNPDEWEPFKVPWVHNMEMILLPIRLTDELALCVSKHAVTNEQYERFCHDADVDEPVGQHLIIERRTLKHDRKPRNLWRGPFYPWRSEDFNHPDQPVVCVSNGILPQFAPPHYRLHYSGIGFKTWSTTIR